MAKKNALIISVSKYNDPDLDKIQFVQNDGEEMFKVLTKLGYDIPKERKLVGKVDFDSMRLSINQFFQDRDLNPDDTLLLYYSGHGDTDGFSDRFFCTTEYDGDRPDNFGLPFSIINNQIKKSNSKRIIVILDCCFSGGLVLETGKAGDKDSEEQAEKLGNEAINSEFKDSTGMYVLASSLSNHLSYKHPQKEMSAFTNFIVEGLNGDEGALDEEGCVTPETLDEFVFKKLKELGGKTLQRPQRSSLVSGKLILASYAPPEMARSRTKSELVSLLKQTPSVRASMLVGLISQESGTPATAFLIGPNLIMTDRAVLPSKDLAANLFVHFDSHVESEPLHYIHDQTLVSETKSFELDPDNIFFTSDLGYTIVSTKNEPGNMYGWVKLDTGRTYQQPKRLVYVIYYSYNNDRVIDLDNNTLDDGNNYAKLSFQSFSESTLTTGAPIFDTEWNLLGMHVGYFNRTSKSSPIPIGAYSMPATSRMSTTLKGVLAREAIWELESLCEKDQTACKILELSNSKNPHQVDL